MPRVQVYFNVKRHSTGEIVQGIGEGASVFLERLLSRVRTGHHVAISFDLPTVERFAPKTLRWHEAPPDTPDRDCRVAFTAVKSIRVYEHGEPKEARGVVCSLQTHRHANLDVIAFETGDAETRAMLAFLAAQVRMRYAFDPVTDVYFAPSTPSGYRWYCVSLVTSALQHGGMLRGINPCALTADELRFHMRFHILSRVAAENLICF